MNRIRPDKMSCNWILTQTQSPDLPFIQWYNNAAVCESDQKQLSWALKVLVASTLIRELTFDYVQYVMLLIGKWREVNKGHGSVSADIQYLRILFQVSYFALFLVKYNLVLSDEFVGFKGCYSANLSVIVVTMASTRVIFFTAVK